MINKIFFKPLIVAFSLSILACGGNKKNSPAPDPGKANLVFPEQNMVCTTGGIVSSTQSTVTLSWSEAQNTDSYELKLKNLLTGATSTETTTSTKFTATLLRNTPYSWYVASKSESSTKIVLSDTWKFYNSGAAIISHPPFPAEVVAPGFAQNTPSVGGMVRLSWTGSDADGDILNYDIYFGASTSPALLKSSITDTFLNNVAVVSGTVYYWKIVSNDSQGNSSTSALFQFKVD
jgi:hypothetical protein